jgi:ubiquitin-like-conjugating enzyme ATG10
MAGSVTLEEFNRCITQVLTISDRLADGWTLHNKDAPEATYLVKKIFVPNTDKKSDVSQSLLLLEEPVDDVLEDVNVITESGSGMITWEYHVLYSHSYSVPILYFNAWTNDGRLLSLEDVWSRVHSNFQDLLQESRWSVLTQQEHPVLRKPFYMLHPCRTAQFLACFHGRSANIVITWLSTVGPAVGLTFGPQYAESTSVELECK